jgi:hypothetical protein
MVRLRGAVMTGRIPRSVGSVHPEVGRLQEDSPELRQRGAESHLGVQGYGIT